MLGALFLILIISLIVCAVPFFSILCLPGKRLSFLAFVFFISYSIYAADSATNYWNGGLSGEFSSFAANLISFSAIFGFIYKIYKLESSKENIGLGSMR